MACPSSFRLGVGSPTDAHFWERRTIGWLTLGMSPLRYRYGISSLLPQEGFTDILSAPSLLTTCPQELREWIV